MLAQRTGASGPSMARDQVADHDLGGGPGQRMPAEVSAAVFDGSRLMPENSDGLENFSGTLARAAMAPAASGLPLPCRAHIAEPVFGLVGQHPYKIYRI